jgi:DNA-binding response OmpR family regulator
MSASQPESPRDKKSILVIEDDLEYQDLVKAILAPRYALVICDRAEDAIEILDNGKFDLILLDINLLGASGFAVLEKLRQEMRLEAMPVLCCSGMGDEVTQSRAKALGAAGFIVKPYQQDAVLKAVSSVIGD